LRNIAGVGFLEISRLPLKSVDETSQGGLVIHANFTNAG
jgi:hypothetical protein